MAATDSRTAVAQALRRQELANTPQYRTTSARRAELRRIAATRPVHEQRVLEALRTGELTADEAVTHLDTTQPHARLCGLRKAGQVLDRWVLVSNRTGGFRRVKAYRMAAGEEAT